MVTLFTSATRKNIMYSNSFGLGATLRTKGFANSKQSVYQTITPILWCPDWRVPSFKPFLSHLLSMCGNTRARTCEIGQNMITRYHENGPTFGEDFRHVSLISRYPWDIPGPSNSLNISVVLHHQAFHQIYGRIERFPKKLGVVYHGCVSHRHGHPPSLLTNHQYVCFKLWSRTSKSIIV